MDQKDQITTLFNQLRSKQSNLDEAGLKKFEGLSKQIEVMGLDDEKTYELVKKEEEDMEVEVVKKDEKKQEKEITREGLAYNKEAPIDQPEEEEEELSDSTRDELLHELETEVEVKLADQQADKNSPLYSAKTFEQLGLSPQLLDGIYSMKYSKPSKIQERALPLLLANPPKNMIGQSQSGTGKTAAFVLTMLSRVQEDLNEVQAICLAPSRELARQIMDVAKQMGQFTSIKLAYAIRNDNKQDLGVIKSHIVIGTPGTMFSMLRTKQITNKFIKLFVLDEADTMLDMQGMGDQCSRVKKLMPPNCTTVLFSATFPEIVREFAKRFAPKANEISLKVKELSIDAIKQFYLDCDDKLSKDDKLCNLYDLMTIGQSIIFVNTKADADRINGLMTEKGHKVISLHGNQTADERDEFIDQFRSGSAKVLISTNVIARGIDISQVNLVINYDMPVTQSRQPDYETYLHRIGRTGRFGKSGVAINFIASQQDFNTMTSIQHKFGKLVEKLNDEDFESMEKLLKKALK